MHAWKMDSIILRLQAFPVINITYSSEVAVGKGANENKQCRWEKELKDREA